MSNYIIHHNSFTSAIQQLNGIALKSGYTIDSIELEMKIGFGPSKPAEGKTNSYHLELLTKKGNIAKKLLHVQVYNRGYHIKNNMELNAYIN